MHIKESKELTMNIGPDSKTSLKDIEKRGRGEVHSFYYYINVYMGETIRTFDGFTDFEGVKEKLAETRSPSFYPGNDINVWIYVRFKKDKSFYRIWFSTKTVNSEIGFVNTDTADTGKIRT